MLARFSRLATVRAVGASVRGVSSKALVFDSYGSPSSVLRLAQTELGEPAANQVLVKMLAAPINPADLNAIEGTYGTSTTLPTVAGSEGVGVVEQVGSGVKSLKVGDRVIPAVPSFGTWRTYALANENQLTTVASDIPIEYAATISVNPATAYRLLADFADLKEGDVIIQNGATSTVGQSVIQLARLRGVKTINVIRSESYDAETVETLKKLGGDIVVTEQYLRTPEFKRLTSDLPAPKLAINSIGGRSATDIARTLEDGGKLVTIGGMSKRPVQIPTSLFIFRNISLHGFWLSKWAETHSASERKEMIDTLCTLVKRQDLSYGIERHKFSTYEKPLAIVASGARHPKLLFQLDL